MPRVPEDKNKLAVVTAKNRDALRRAREAREDEARELAEFRELAAKAYAGGRPITMFLCRRGRR